MMLPIPLTLHTVRPLAALGVGIIALWSTASTTQAAEPVAASTAIYMPACPAETTDAPAFSAAYYTACKQTLDSHIADYQQTGDNLKLHAAYKALAWLTYANYEYHMNSRAASKNIAWQNAYTLIDQLARNQLPADILTDVPSHSALMRPDLWAYLSALQEKGANALTPREMAFAEVSLIWAGTEQCTHGWRQSTPHFRMASRYLMQANTAHRNHYPDDSAVLSDLIQRYYQAYLPLDNQDDVCRGQSLPRLP